MTETFILSRIYEKSTFQVGSYRVPKFILPKKIGPKIDLLSSRQSQLIRGQTNPNNQGFEIFLVSNPDLPEVIRELPVIAPEGSDKNFYILDYFFPTLGLAIELDSKTYHQKTKDQKKTGDLKLLGIDTLRVYGFWDPVQRKNLSDIVKKTVLGRSESKLHFPIDYVSRLIQDFKIINREALQILNSKPMSGIDPNLYILTKEEEDICKDCLDLLGI